MVRARDVMERQIITISPETRILDVHRLFVEEEIHGAPVVSEDGVVVGVLSSLDLLRIVHDADDVDESVQNLTADQAMTRELVTVGPDAAIEDVARLMHEHRVHRVLVVDEGAIAGMITTFDLLPVLARFVDGRSDPQHRTGYTR